MGTTGKCGVIKVKTIRNSTRRRYTTKTTRGNESLMTASNFLKPNDTRIKKNPQTWCHLVNDQNVFLYKENC